MDVDHLLPSEFEIECSVRGLSGTPVQMYANLKKCLEAESTTPVLRPHRSHSAARKNPKREIQLCGEKLRELQAWMVSHCAEKNKSEFAKIESRVRHIEGRLFRLKDSKAARREQAYDVVSTGCKTLFDSIHKAVTEDTSLETSLQDINSVTLDGVEVPEDEWTSESDDGEQDAKREVRFSPKVQKALDTFKKTHGFGLELHLTGESEETAQPVLRQEERGEPSSAVSPSTSTDAPNPRSTEVRATHLDPSVTKPEDELMSLLNAIDQRLTLEKVSVSNPRPLNIPASLPPQVPLTSQNQTPIMRTSDPVVNESSHIGFNTNIPPPPIQHHNTSTSQPFSASNPMWAQLQACNPQDFGHGYPSDGSKNLKNWNLKFEGLPSDGNVKTFIFKVEWLAQSYNVSAMRLVKELSVLLRGEAYHWYWTYIQRHGLVSWPQLRSEFINTYQSRCSDDDVRRDLEARKQKFEQNESFLSFYNDMSARSLNFSGVFPDNELLRIIRQNMRPGLQLALEGQSIRDTKTLIQRCLSLEDTWKRLHYNPEWGCQSRRHVHELYRDNVHHEDQIPGSSHNEFMFPQPTSNVGVKSASGLETMYPSESYTPPEVCAFTQRNPCPSPSTNFASASERENLTICWNCQDIGHYFQNCPMPIKRQFCFGCGRSDTVKPNCPRCKAAGNAMPRVRFTGRSPLQNPLPLNPSPHPPVAPKFLQNLSPGNQSRPSP